MFDGSKSSIIVISSYQIFGDRYGPKTQRKWRMQKKQQYASDDDLDSAWPDNLQDCFHKVICDEVHTSKPYTYLSTTIMWLKAKFHVLATASPMPNRIEDWKGYMSFIEHEVADNWWSAQFLTELDFAEDGEHPEDEEDNPQADIDMDRPEPKDGEDGEDSEDEENNHQNQQAHWRRWTSASQITESGSNLGR